MKRKISLAIFLLILVLSCLSLGVYDGTGRSVDEDTEYYVYGSSIVKAEERLNTDMADYAINLFTRVNDEMLSESNDVYFALIPDKEKYIDENKVYYDEFYEYFKYRLPFATMIDVFDTIQFSDYYRTDPHLRQDKLVALADKMSTAMGNDSLSNLDVNFVDTDFSGSYTKHVDFSLLSDEFYYLSNDVVDSLKTKEGVEIYDFGKLETDEPYEFFLSGNQSVVTIQNENAKSEKRLVVFRDSFFSNLAPIISTQYSEVVLVDLRFVMSEYVDELVNFENADVLFAYSTLLLNNSMSMK